MTTPQLVTVALSVVLLVVLVALLLVQWRTGRLGRLSVWATRVLLVGSVLVSVVAILEVRREIIESDLPWTRPGGALGTFVEPTALGVIMVAVIAGLFVVAAGCALVRPRWAVGLYLVIAAWSVVSGVRTWLTDPTAPRDSAVMGVLFLAGPALVLAALVWLNRGRIIKQRARTPSA